MTAMVTMMHIYVSKVFKFSNTATTFTLLYRGPRWQSGVRFPARPQVGKLVVACRWLAVYSTEP